jgi:hypothetical protein
VRSRRAGPIWQRRRRERRSAHTPHSSVSSAYRRIAASGGGGVLADRSRNLEVRPLLLPGRRVGDRQPLWVQPGAVTAAPAEATTSLVGSLQLVAQIRPGDG